MVARVLPELLVDQPQVAAEARIVEARTPRIPGSASAAEQLEDRRGLAREHVVRGDLEEVAAHLEARVQRHAAAPPSRGSPRGTAAAASRSAGSRPSPCGSSAASAARPQRVGGVLVAEHLRDAALVVEQQPVLAAAGQHVQREAHLPQERLRRRSLRRSSPAVRKPGDAARRASRRRSGAWPPSRWSGCRAGPRAGLDVRLEVVGGVVRRWWRACLFATLARRTPRPARRWPRRAPRASTRTGAQGPGEQPRLDQRGHDADVGRALRWRTRRRCARCGRPRGRCPRGR